MKGQTILSGVGTNTCTPVANAGASGSNTSIGCGAGGGAGASDTYNTYVGTHAGFSGTPLNPVSYNTAVGGGALYSNIANGFNNAFGYGALYTNTTGLSNDAFGYQALYLNLTGKYNAAFGDYALYNNTANYSTATGYEAMYNNIGGAGNTAFGAAAAYSNTTGGYNTAVGYSAMYYNNGGSYNTATGWESLLNGSASNNTAYGYSTLSSITNTSASGNVAVGDYALSALTTGGYNTGMGHYALYSATTGTANVGVGDAAGGTITTGNNNTFLGYGANAGSNNLSNATAIGNGAIVGNSNEMYFGNAATTNLRTNVGIFATSDGRFKTNVTENVKGLAFINKLRPVTYNLNTEALDNFLIQNLPDSIKTVHKAGLDFAPSMAIVHSGFIAQEVETAAQQTGFTSSIVSIPADPNKTNYGVNYAELVVPLVKAVQELSHKVDSLLGITKAAGQRKAQTGNNNGGLADSAAKISAINVQLSNVNAVVLNQNQPNPFAEQTIITYNIPQNANSAQILFYDANGKQINSVTITTKGAGQLNVYANDLSNGTYSYTLIVDGAVIDTKKMIKQ